VLQRKRLGRLHFHEGSLPRVRQEILDRLGKPGKWLSDPVKRSSLELVASTVAGLGGGLGTAAGVFAGSRAATGLAKGWVTRVETQVQKMALRAALEPEYAALLAKKATAPRVKEAIDKLAILAQTANAARIGYGTARNDDSERQRPDPAPSKPSQPEERKNTQLPSPTASNDFVDHAMNRAEAKGDDMLGLFKKKTVSEGDVDLDKRSKDYVRKVEAKIDADPYYSALYEAESGRNPTAKNPESTASGAFQFLKGTAKLVGLKDPMDIGEAFDKVKTLTNDHKRKFGDSPAAL
jgi:hypothetical protein